MSFLKTVVALAIGVVVCHGLNGLMLSTLWEWFVLPIFQVPKLEFLQAVGVCIVVNFLVMKNKDLGSPDDHDPIKDTFDAILKYSVYCGLLICTSWVVKTIM